MANKDLVEVLQLAERRGVYKEINYYKLRKNDGNVVKVPFFGSLKIGEFIYCPL